MQGSAMVKSEREMVCKFEDDEVETQERSTSLQPTYEDSVPPDLEHDWQYD